MKYFKLITLFFAVTIIAGFAYAGNTIDRLSIEFIELSKIKETFDMTIETYVQQLSAQNPGTDKAKLREFFKSYMGWDVLKNPTIQIVSKAFSEKELQDLISFYKSESGRSYANKSPHLSAEISKVIALNMQKAMSKLQQQ
jgi:uncharacterized protein